ncbi:hypothetical protein [Spirosoma validum]|uniref:Uncharacterized protein n=1 Tax=Spirosoma validum TaxID=2771355 RepID=A0A927B1E6_9BACT|nr:hypothetical protein [Spirosoma validum]MBD2753800.1 hypothetical protein [Spirosoma validum]
MLYCKPKHPTPCIRYDKANIQDLIDFVNANGGELLHIEAGGTAHVSTFVKGEKRYVYLNEGNWLRCIGPGQFLAVTNVTFEDQFELIDRFITEEGTDFGSILESVERAEVAFTQIKQFAKGQPTALDKILKKLGAKG